MAFPLTSMDPYTSLLLGGVVLLCLLWWMSTRRPLGLPPGPGGALPLLGHLHLLGKDPRPRFSQWRRQFGDVFSLYMGGKLVVVLCSYSAIREALVTLGDAFSDRPKSMVHQAIFKEQGVGLASGALWKEQRKTAVTILRTMGMGKNLLADKIQEEITHYIRAIKDHQGAPVDLSHLTQISICNNICSIVFGRRFDYDDPLILYFIKKTERIFELIKGTTILNFMPSLRYVPGDPFKNREILRHIEDSLSFVEKNVASHQQTLQEEGDDLEKNDFIYSYLRQIQQNKGGGNIDSTLDVDNLCKTCNNLFDAGTETTSTCLRWAMIFFLHNPHVQDKCFQEISDVIGLHRPPNMSDKPNLTYLEATICEILRKGDLVPLSLLHATSSDVTFRDYVIPKGTMVIPNLGCVLQDPEIWGDPENFRPERFIGPDGKVTKPDEFIPFGTGRRICLGESLGRMELFLYVATLIQHFHFLPAEDGQLPSLEGVLGLTLAPHPFKIRAVPRM